MSLEAYIGAVAEFTFDVDDPTTVGADDFSAVSWAFRIHGDADTLEVAGTIAGTVVTVTIDGDVTETIAPGHYHYYLVAVQTGADEVVAGEGVLTAKTYPAAPA